MSYRSTETIHRVRRPYEFPPMTRRVCCPYKGDHLTYLYLDGGTYRRESNDDVYFDATTESLTDPVFMGIVELEYGADRTTAAGYMRRQSGHVDETVEILREFFGSEITCNHKPVTDINSEHYGLIEFVVEGITNPLIVGTAEMAEPETVSLPVWEILVPAVSNEGTPYRTRYHRVWDEKAKAITGGLTIMPPVRGVWVSDAGDAYRERMIPVKIACNREQIIEIAEMTKKYYNQLAVIAYKISDETLIV